MKNTFWNRTEELARIQRLLKAGGLGFVTGRRRVGKTALLGKACEDFNGIYHQAVEGTPEQQLLHLTEELRDALPIFRDVLPKTWVEFFRLLTREKLPPLLVFDEFPYWVQGDPTLPSVLQKWVDHELPRLKTLVLISGSSQSMLHSQFLQQEEPLYGRATFHLKLAPMSYEWFCRALNYDAKEPLSFSRFSLVGGIPHYWKLMPKGSFADQAEELFFRPSALLAQEPHYWLRDEGLTGALLKALLDFVGRGVAKPSELASRLNNPQGNLSRPLALLLDLGFIQKESPFGETARSTKKVLYSVQDPALSFYYGTFLIFRHRWKNLEMKEKEALLNHHVSRQWENFCRGRFPGSGRYWEGKVEIDLVADQPKKKRTLVAECKWTTLTPSEKNSMRENLKLKFLQTQLSKKLKNVSFQVFTKEELGALLKETSNESAL